MSIFWLSSRKKFRTDILLFSLFAIVFLILARVWSSLSVETSLSLPTVSDSGILLIDAGHGGFDPGAVAADGTQEKEINLAIAMKLRAIAEANGIRTFMIRESDCAVYELSDETSGSNKARDIHYRASLADEYPGAVYISIHQNSFSDRSQHGAQLFYGIKNSGSELLAECIRLSIVGSIQPTNDRPLKRGTDDIYILCNVNCPMTLVECGFISNSAELEKLVDEDYQREIACAIFWGYLSYLSER